MRKSTRAFFSAASVRAAISLLFKSASCASLSATVATMRKPVLLAKCCYRFFRVAKLPAQFDQAVAQPTRGSLGGLKTSIKLVDDIGIGYRVGELGGSDRIFPSDGNVEH